MKYFIKRNNKLQYYRLIKFLSSQKPFKSKSFPYLKHNKNTKTSFYLNSTIYKKHIQIKQKDYKNHSCLFQAINKILQLETSPIKIILQSPLTFTYPQKIIIRVSKLQKVNGFEQIDYKFNNEGVIYLQVKSSQFLCQDYANLLKGSQQSNQKSQKYSISVPQMKLQKQNYQIPQFVDHYFSQKGNQIYKVNLWHYKKETVTKWHYDAHDNFLFQIKGHKVLQLSPPNSIKQISDKLNSNSREGKRQDYRVCNSVFDQDNNHINQQIQKQGEFSLRKKNQCLFIPKGWFHHVQSYLNQQGDNIAVNFWGNTIPTFNLPKSQLQINLKYIIWQMAQAICLQNVSDWNQLPQQLKVKFRQAYFFRYFNLLNVS